MPENSHTIGIVTAVLDELTPLLSRVQPVLLEWTDRPAGAPPRVYRSEPNGRRVVAAVAGVGAGRVVAAMDWLIDEQHVDRVIHLGFAGGLDPALAAGDVPAIQWAINEAGDGIHLTGSVPEPAGGDAASRVPANTILTLDRIADSPAVKKQLFERHRAAMVDMETFHAASHARQRDVAYTALRAVSDPADVALPAAALGWVTADGVTDVKAVTQYLAMHPWQMPALLRLQNHAKLAGQRLAEHTAQLIAAE